MRMSNGWIKLHRQLQDNPIWYEEQFTRGQAWVDMLLDANHGENSFLVRGNRVVVPRGFIGKSEDTLAGKWKWSRGKVRRFLKALESVQQIRQHKSKVLSLIEVINYNRYQVDDTANGTTDSTTERQQTVQQKDTNKNVKNAKNEKKITLPSVKGPRPSVETVIKAMKETFGTLDGSEQENRRYAWLLIQKAIKTSGQTEEQAAAACVNLVVAAKGHEWWGSKITKVEHLYRSAHRIANDIRSDAKPRVYFIS